MTQEEIARYREMIKIDRVHYKMYMGIQFLLDKFELTLNALEAQQDHAAEVREAALEEAALAAEACASAANNNFIWEAAQRNIAEDIRLLKEKPAGRESEA